ncbi:MAG: bifunctional phosphopantothenoylcysteine decarboxylase/phosphopantothenate--cysteine ligase CoaBC [Desulfuromonas sp.]|nr:MAG: bifunctional phosphopantothenoylcysteine decarboxylase/phosphopantothenate--cysteine ligase CoaBC [Desulfuromonas sp.]
MLTGKTIVLGVTGGIAAYKAVEVLRLLTKAGATVHVVMTRHAMEFVAPLTFQTLSNNPVHSELFDLYQEKEIGHISLADRADLFLVAPATANIVGKVASGIADDLLSTALMATKSKVMFVPAMNVNMWENPVYRRNQQQLEELGCLFMEPDTGSLACGWEGKGKFPDPAEIVSRVVALLANRDLQGETLLVTAGPTREAIDPVRYLTNHSSGKMGYAIAQAALERGAEVVLVSGPTSLTPPSGATFVQVTTALEMQQAVFKYFDTCTIVIKAAAVADYRPVAPSDTKLKKRDGLPPVIEMTENPDILAALGGRKQQQLLVGFAAETEALLENARQKIEKKNLDLIVANDITEEGAGFDLDTNIVRFICRDGEIEALEKMTKTEVAHRLLDKVREMQAD